jgi:hypothetical protein
MTNDRYARISITLPADTLALADALARRADRSRSWVMAEALRQYAEGEPSARVPQPGTAVSRVAEQPAAYAFVRNAAPVATLDSGLDASRLAQLQRDLALTPEARVREAEETMRLSELVRGHETPPGPRAFERYEDFVDWQHFGRLVEP